MRTDSTTLSETALTAARDQARRLYGSEYVPDAPRHYDKKVKNAQEAHEAIRPAGDRFRTPDEVARELEADELRLYDLVWKRTVASQMADARGQSAQVRVGATSSTGEDAELAASGKVITFPGFLRAYVEGSDDPEAELEDQEVRLPPLAVGDRPALTGLEPKDHETQPPARYTEASLVKALEELGVGRPSTYASIIETIQDRGYVGRKGTALVPSFTAFAVVGLLEQHFGDLVDYDFTARMEDGLDEIAAGREEQLPWLTRFYFGNGQPGLHTMVHDRLADIDAREINSIPIGADDQGEPVVVRVGRYGPYVQRGEDKASIADDLPPDELTVERALELLAAGNAGRVLGTDPETGLPVIARAGRYGPYVQRGELDPDGGGDKPKTASLFKDMSLESVTLDDALRLLSLPRSLGADPADGQEVTVQNGRYGPYVKKGTDSRSLGAEAELFTVTLDRALALLAQPKRGRGAAPAAPPLRELGPDPVSGQPIVLKDGRFGPYVTDGEVNASLRKDDDVETITPARAAALLQERREREPVKRRGARKAAAKKTPAKKKATAKKKVAAKKKAAAKETTATEGAEQEQ
jgi:DNA topoisomerase-1